MPIRTTAALAAAALLALPAAAEETRHAEAHVHGVSHLQLAVEGAGVEMELHAPGADIVGFEHPAEADEDKAAVEAALALLADPAALFGLAGCEAQEVDAHLDLGGEHEEHAHEEHGEGERHDHDAHQGEEHEHEGGHSEFHAAYALTCAAAPNALDLSGFFAAFPNAQEVEIEAVTDAGAQAREATRAAPAVALD